LQEENADGRKGNLMKWREQLNGDCPTLPGSSPAQA
jgi:hypothetical protein